MRRILNQARSQQQRNYADWNIHKENPAPGVVVSDPSAESGPDRRGHNHRDSVDSERHAAFSGREGVGKNRLLARLQPAATSALQHAEENQHGEIRRQPAKQRADGEQRNAAHVKPLTSDDRRNPAAKGQNDRIRNEIGGKNPRALVCAG